MHSIRIAVIDTHVATDHIALQGASFRYAAEYTDQASNNEHRGHGTAVCGILLRTCKEIDITLYPIFNDIENGIEISRLINILEDILKEDVPYELINMSFGVVEVEDIGQIRQLESLCRKFAAIGTIIVAAYDNNGSMTYPSCFETVIGVDITLDVKRHNKFIYVQNSPINIRGCARPQRVPWDTPEFMLCVGSSFIVPYIVGLIASIMVQNKKRLVRSAICDLLCERAQKVISMPLHSSKPIPMIKKAIVFPLNKETESLIRMRPDLKIEIVGFYDSRHKRMVGRTLADVATGASPSEKIMNVEDIAWDDDFDTIILGHFDELLSIMGNDVLKMIIHKASQYNKQIFAYDNIIASYLQGDTPVTYYASYTEKDVPREQFGKMWRIHTPTVGVLGTKSQQGKFTLQISLIKALNQLGYDVGFYSSEVTGHFFGAQCIYPYGYNSAVSLQEEDFILTSNKALHEVDMQNHDILITGGQSGVLPYDPYHASRFLIHQHNFLLSVQPDCFVLCVSCDDEIEYIQRSLSYIQSLSEAPCIAIYVYPLVSEMFMVGRTKKRNILHTTHYHQYIQSLQILSLPVLNMTADGASEGVGHIVDFFQREV